jgi:hypothetical protein
MFFHRQNQLEILKQFRDDGHIKSSDNQLNKFLSYVRSLYYYEELVEGNIKNILDDLYKKKAIIVGLTARKSLIADQTNRMLLSHHIDFGSLSGLADIEMKGDQGELMTDGIFYTCNIDPKAEYIEPLIEQIRLIHNLEGPINAYHFDDSYSEIDAYETTQASQNNLTNMCITPCHYICHSERVTNMLDHFEDDIYLEVLEEVKELLWLYITKKHNNNLKPAL